MPNNFTPNFETKGFASHDLPIGKKLLDNLNVAIRLDNAVIETIEPWANKIRVRNIGDFTRWKEHGAYKATFERVLSELKADR